MPTFEPITLHHPDVTLSHALRAAEQVAQRLRSLSVSVGPSSLATQFYTRIRVKSEDSIQDKLTRNQIKHENPAYSFADLDDLIGFRIVTLYDEDLERGMEYVIDLVNTGQQLSQPLFKGEMVWDAFKEAKFTERARGDRYEKCAAWLKGKISDDSMEEDSTSLTGRVIIEPSPPSGYSSGHLIFNAVSYPLSGTRRASSVLETNGHDISSADRILIPVEFQIRAAHEDIWGEINHRFLYKIRSPYVWSPDFAREYEHTLGASNTLKDLIDRIPDAINSLVVSSRAAKSQLDKFDKPQVHYHFSLGASLFWCLNPEYPTRLDKLFSEYQVICEKIAIAHTHKRSRSAAILTRDAILRVADIKSEIKTISESAALASSEKEADVRLTLFEQRNLICDFDMLRLSAMALLEWRYEIVDSNVKSCAHDKEAESRKCIDLYAAFCRLKDNPAFSVRPISVILSWKYRLARLFDLATAARNLEDAYAELKVDTCVPGWSVYRVLIPRELARVRALEATYTFKSVDTAGVKPRDMSGLAREIKEKLVYALRYALEAFEVYYRDSSDNRGDFVYGPPEHGDAIRDARQVVDIYLFFVEGFGTISNQSKGIHVSDLQRVVSYVESLRDNPNTPAGKILTEDGQKSFLDDLASVKKWLQAESNTYESDRSEHAQ